MFDKWIATAVDWAVSETPSLLQGALVVAILCLLALALIWGSMLIDREEMLDIDERVEPEPDFKTQPFAHWKWRQRNMTDAERDAWEAVHLPADIRLKKDPA